MMNKSIIACLVILLTGSIVLAHDVVIPPWRGTPGSTYQQWEFGTSNTTPLPDVVNNPYGTPLLRVTPNGEWISDIGRWPLSGEIDVIIPNRPEQLPIKYIQIQLSWIAGGQDPFLPDVPLIGIASNPESTVTIPPPKVVVINEGMGLMHSTYSIVLEPNPFEEWIAIKGDISVDELIIDTICTPEPTTICLLGLGALTLLRKRRV